MDIKHIKNLLDIFEGTVERRCAIYEIADDEDDENRAAAECGAAKARSIKKIHRLNADCAAAVWGNALHSDAFWLLTHGMGAVQGKFGLKICAAA